MQNRVLNKCGSLMMQLPLEDWQLTLHQWWQLVTMVGPDFGYYPNASKTHLVLKPELVNKADIIERSEQFTKPQLQSVKSALHWEKCLANAAKAEQIKGEISATLQRAMELGTEKGASTRLTALPLQEQGFTLNKQEFQDALCLRYGWQLKNLPSHCVCGSVFSTDHAMTCSHGGLTITRHNDICDITANWLSEVCRNVENPPYLQNSLHQLITYTQSQTPKDIICG